MRQKGGSKPRLSPAEITCDLIDFINKGSVILPTLLGYTRILHGNTSDPSVHRGARVFAESRQVNRPCGMGAHRRGSLRRAHAAMRPAGGTIYACDLGGERTRTPQAPCGIHWLNRSLDCRRQTQRAI